MPELVTASELRVELEPEVRQLWKEFPELQVHRYADGEYLVPPGDASLDIFLLLKGCCAVQPGGEGIGNHATAAIIEATPDQPVFVGEVAYLGAGERIAAVRSAMACWALKLKPKHLDAIMDRYPQLTRTLCRQFALRLGQAMGRLRALDVLMRLPLEHRFAVDGETIFTSGEMAGNLFHLVDGSIRLETRDEHKVIEARGSEPPLLNAAAFFRGEANSATATAIGGATLLAIPADARVQALRKYPEAVLTALVEPPPQAGVSLQ